ncbi:adenylate/guanylate cyclase domain-containing protein [Thalassobius vesicularis]|uniref:Adenylate/guanylate cyclase domain-containing protein n=1 Tax=Thalassobius vesicularis TaxID=1294297 RepID=A0A4S3M771_9RHOB|nr:adenylate/guanylate cyclase domain-containing protein [Thalassobius vesicularis]THD72589.1 adenylate/guanylate cyclase domain-containing protein [Thalassobius vesicularis]
MMWRRWAVPLSALAVALLLVLGLSVVAPEARARLVTFGEDAALAYSGWAQDAPNRVVIVNIDSASLQEVGPWPWRRKLIAMMVKAVGRAGASAVAVDILFAGADTRSPAAMARALAQATGRTELARTVPGPDDDQLFAAAMTSTPTVLGFALAPAGGATPRSAPVLMPAGAAEGFWAAAGAEAADTTLAAAAAGQGALAILTEPDGVVRRVPVVVSIEGAALPGLALEASRVVSGAPFIRLDPIAGRFAAGAVQGRMDARGFLRLLPRGRPGRGPISVSAADVLAGRFDPDQFRGRLVMIGGSAPEIGAIRSLPWGETAATVEIQARAAQQMLLGLTPVSASAGMVWGSVALAVVLSALIPLAPPILAVLGLLAGVGAFVMLSLRLAQDLILFDPVFPGTVLLLSGLCGLVASFAISRRQAARIRQRFEQHLAPQVVARIVKAPHLMKQSGERRVVTALFTDLEGFSAMTRRTGPERLIEMLDQYFEGITAIILRHGGMVDKIVGDAVHVLFNAPIDQPDHALSALRCATEIATWSEALRQRPDLAADGFGRTRIGIETGPAVVGDVGRGAKLDYTAHGDVINTAARLEAMNKELGTTICVGPGTASLCPPGMLRAIGRVSIRGIGDGVEVFTTLGPDPPGFALLRKEHAKR